MNILIISHAAGTPDIGPNMRTYYLGRNLVNRGHKIHIVGSGIFHKYKKSPLKKGKYTSKVMDGINYHWLPTFNYKKRNYQQVFNQLDFVFKLWQFRKKLMDISPDLIIVSSPPPFAVHIAAKIANSCNSKLIFEIRDLWPEIIEDLGNFKKTHPYILMIRFAVKKAYKLSDGVVSVKPGDLKYIRENYNLTGLTTYIPNGFDHTALLDEDFSHPAFENKGFKIVYTGALSSYYAIEYLLFAAEKLKNSHPDIKFILVGDGENKTEMEKIKKERNLNNVTFLGHLPKKHMLSVIRQGDVAFLGLRNTKANQLGISTNKLYEYMFAKKPIIASYNTDYDIVKESKAGISVVPESGFAIHEAIISLYNMSDIERNELGENGYSYLMKHHTFEKITNLYLKFIASL